MLNRHHCVVVLLLGLWSQGARADVVEYDGDFGAWLDAAAVVTTIGFSEVPEFTVVTTEYEEHGVIFQGNAFTIAGPKTFLSDGWGLSIFTGQVLEMDFMTPHTSIGVRFPGHIQIDLYSDGELFYASSELGMSGVDNFAGLVSCIPFDRAVVYDGGDFAASIDDLHFGSVPLVGDVNEDGVVGVADLVSLITAWGPCGVGGDCPADLNGDAVVDVSDLLLIFLNWTP